MIVVHDAKVDISHLEISGERQDDQLHDRDDEDNLRHEPVPTDLLELFL